MASKLDKDLTAFVHAADRLVNLLNGPKPTRRSAQRKHAADLEAAYNAYDDARFALMGDPADE